MKLKLFKRSITNWVPPPQNKFKKPKFFGRSDTNRMPPQREFIKLVLLRFQ